MALDNAEFISELSIVDPPGTDPLNQGDDHIRTVKRATQQSFPNVNAAVPQTAAQMAQMAIKNEANTFTLTNTFQASQTFQNGMIVSGGVIHGPDGLAAAPGYTFGNDPLSGMWRVSLTALAISTAGVERLRISESQIRARSPWRGLVGDATAPAYSFEADTDTGIFQGGNNVIGFATLGVERMRLFATEIRAQVPFSAQPGTAAAPSHSFQAELSTGMYRRSAQILAFSVFGVRQVSIFTNAFQTEQQILAPVLASATPAYAFTGAGDTGINYNGANGVDAVVAGAVVFAMSSNGMFAGVGFQMHVDGDLPAATPGWTFSNDGDTGWYRAGVNTLGFATAGISRGTIDSSAMWFANGVSIHGDAAGSAADPSYAYTNDTDTGMFRRAVNAIGFSAGGNEICNIGTGGFGIVSGKLAFLNLPTSPSTGGSLWNDGGTVKVA